MGQAKVHGTREQRVFQAIRQNFLEGDVSKATESAVYDMMSNQRSRLLDLWKVRATTLDLSLDRRESTTFFELLKFVWLRDWHGACHSSSAVLYMLFAEHGMKPTLCIGEVARDGDFFDHSWVELDGFIFDAAVSLPSKNGDSAFVGGPVYKSIDLSSDKLTGVAYGVKNRVGLSSPARQISQSNLAEYCQTQIADGVPLDGTIWGIADFLLGEIGVPSNVEDLADRYGSLIRTIRA